MSLADRYYIHLAAAFVRGKARQGADVALPETLGDAPLAELSTAEAERIYEFGRTAGLKLHKFKKSMGLRRVQRVFGALRAIDPNELLDIGSGRGVFLWPLLDEFPHLQVTAIDQDARRAGDLQAVSLGGVARLAARCESATELPLEDSSHDVVTMLEVLEHIRDAPTALREVVRVARRFVVLTVPSKEDDNPEHIHLFDGERLRAMFSECGVERLSFDYVPGHMVVVANVTSGE